MTGNDLQFPSQPYQPSSKTRKLKVRPPSSPAVKTKITLGRRAKERREGEREREREKREENRTEHEWKRERSQRDGGTVELGKKRTREVTRENIQGPIARSQAGLGMLQRSKVTRAS